jgi:hypothetical protein
MSEMENATLDIVVEFTYARPVIPRIQADAFNIQWGIGDAVRE